MKPLMITTYPSATWGGPHSYSLNLKLSPVVEDGAKQSQPQSIFRVNGFTDCLLEVRSLSNALGGELCEIPAIETAKLAGSP